MVYVVVHRARAREAHGGGLRTCRGSALARATNAPPRPDCARRDRHPERGSVENLEKAHDLSRSAGRIWSIWGWLGNAASEDLVHAASMPKSRKRKPKKPKARRPQALSSEATFAKWDFKVPLPDAPDEVLKRICPLSPEQTLERGQLIHSPASTYIHSPRDGVLAETLETVGRWPFRIAREGEAGGGWVCLALLAYEQGLTVEDTARALIDLEDSRLLTWSGEHHVYVMSPETPTNLSTPEDLGRVS